MRAIIKIKRGRDPKTGQTYRAVYFGREHVAPFWSMASALDCARCLAELSGAPIQSAEIIAFRKGEI